jgi:phage shock protein PspC (stress-responsive transcriptional regulator)
MTENTPPPGAAGGSTTEEQRPPTDADDSSGPRVTGAEVRDLARLRRSATDRKVAGVAGGLGRHLDIDPVLLRVAFVVLTFFGGAGVLLYAAAWLLVPDEVTGRATLDTDTRTRTVALVGVGALGVLMILGDWGGWWFPWPVVVIALLAWLVLSRRGGPTAPPAGTAYPSTEGAPVGAGTPPGTTAYAAPVAARRPRDPRKRGPVLFWFTLALTALALGTLGTIDLAGVDVADGAYPALALAIVAGMLLVGAFYGRAGGLVLLGFLALFGLVAATVTDRWDGRVVVETPTSAAEVDEEYWNGAGETRLDLSEVADVEELDGRRIEVDGGVGRIEVTVPDGMDVTVLAGSTVPAASGSSATSAAASRSPTAPSWTAGRTSRR